MISPQYSYPAGMITALSRDFLLLRKRDFHKDAKACIVRLIPSLDVIRSKNIRGGVPCVITVNHYHREGFAAQCFALAISALVTINYFLVGQSWGNHRRRVKHVLPHCAKVDE